MLHSANKVHVLLFLVLVFRINVSLASEPACSRFDYEEKLLEKTIRFEVKQETIEREIRKSQDFVLDNLNEIKDKVADISDRFEDLKNNITEEMVAKTKDIEKKEELLKNLFEELRTNLTNDVEVKRNALTELKEEMTRPSVAFHAYHVTDLALDVKDKIIVFDTIITNEGSGYDRSTGIFTAPFGGLYKFTVHVCSTRGKYSIVGLSQAGKLVAAAVNNDKDYDTCSSIGAVVRVSSGEQIWVKCTSGSPNYRLYQNSYRMNTFSGILLNK